ncbi:MAG: glycoside hydrolase family 97 protein [Bacteroidales bacterium]|nr:glycoside hydrolase family 97 protein [Bacteroidales bacterium]
MKRTLLTVMAVLAGALALGAAEKNHELRSPDGKICAVVHTGETLSYELSREGCTVLGRSEIALNIEGGVIYGGAAKLQKAVRSSVRETIESGLYKRASIDNNYNELTLTFKDFQLVFRAYDQGVAYRFVTRSKNDFKVLSEKAEFNFTADRKAWVPYVRQAENQFYNSFENYYRVMNISSWEKNRLAFLPVLVEGEGGLKVCITEADLFEYPGMYLSNNEGGSVLKGVYAPVPDTWEQGGHNMLEKIVLTRKECIAECTPSTIFPWRIVSVAVEDKDLLENDMVFCVSKAPEARDWSWVKPGKVAWDWWNDWNIRGVDFEAGINNATYKYYIDFAADNGIEYVILDEGWAVNRQADLFQVVPEIDLQMLCDYGAEKGVGIILWAGYWAFDRDMEKICEHYSKMGVKGFKVDFMDADDQQMAAFHHRSAQMAAKYGLMLDFHGTYKPTGLHRTYPNVINFEGVNGLEQLKWAQQGTDQVTYDVTIPFVRMVAGPMDYTQGAMRNATWHNYRPVNSEPMSQGTRCRQLAEYMVFTAPLSMLCDAPSNYLAEDECRKFIAEVPTVWDETVALESKVGEYVAVARRSGSTWYIGAMTDWTARDMELDLSFIGRSGLKGVAFSDGANAHRCASDFTLKDITVPENGKLKIHLAPGGGFAAVLE